jgi:hypothetical protein
MAENKLEPAVWFIDSNYSFEALNRNSINQERLGFVAESTEEQ